MCVYISENMLTLDQIVAQTVVGSPMNIHSQNACPLV